MDLQKLAQLAKNNPNAAKAFLNKKSTETNARPVKKKDKVFTERQLKMIVETLVKGEVAKIPTPKDGKTPTKEEITQLIKPLMPVIRQPKDGKDAEVTPDFVDKVANRVLKQVSVTPDLSEAILKVFSQEKVKAENIPGFTELKERVEQLARNQKYIGQGKGIAAGYTDTDVKRVIDSYGGGSSLPDQTGNAGKFLTTDGSDASWGTPAGSGDVVGPASAVDSNLAAFDTTTGKLIKDSSITTAEVTANTTYRGVGHIPLSQKGANNGVAELDAGGKVPSAQLPSFVDDVLEYADLASFPATGETGKIYVAQDTNIVYRWSGSAYVEISASLALGETSSTAYRGDRGKIAYDHSQVTTGNPHNVLATQITDFDTEVANNSAVTANTAKVSYPGSATATELNILDGATVTTAELNILDGVTATTAEINKLDGVAGDVVGTTDTQTVTNKRNIATIDTKTASYTLALADASKTIQVSVASANTVTIPPNSSVAFEIGTRIAIRQTGAGSTTVTAGSGVTLNTPSTVSAAIGEQYETRVCEKVDTDVWVLV